jgi:hypothetical protein
MCPSKQIAFLCLQSLLFCRLQDLCLLGACSVMSFELCAMYAATAMGVVVVVSVLFVAQWLSIVLIMVPSHLAHTADVLSPHAAQGTSGPVG